MNKRPARIKAWAIWIPMYGKWVPVTHPKGPNIPYLYRTRADATRVKMGHERIVRVEIRPLGRDR